MCTVTFIPVGEYAYFTHNRDEHKSRPKAIPPATYLVNGHKLLFPKDSKAGRTWIAMNANGRAAALLNGAFVKHDVLPDYRKSRGLVLLEMLAVDDILLAWTTYNLLHIEPFTLIVYTNASLWECRWDGLQKHLLELDSRQTHMWSSATLYDENAMNKRRKWLDDWQQINPSPSMNDIVDFQCSAGEGDASNNLRMNRAGVMLTVSITSMQLAPTGGLMKYIDLQENISQEQKMTFHEALVES